MLSVKQLIFSLLLIFYTYAASIAQKWTLDKAPLTREQSGVVSLIQRAERVLEKSATDTTCFSYLQTAEADATALKFHHALAVIFNIKGTIYFNRSDWEHAISQYEKSLEAAKRMQHRNDRASMMMNSWIDLAEVYNYNGDYVTALEKRMEALKYEDSTDITPSQRLNLYLSIANDFRHLNQQRKAIEYLEMAKNSYDEAQGSDKLNYLYEYYQNQLKVGELHAADSLLSLFDEGLKTFKLTETQQLEFGGMSHKLHGQYELNYTKHYENALYHYQQYLAYYQQLNNMVHISIAYNKIGLVYVAMGNDQAAIQPLEKALQICIEEKNLDYGFETAQILSGAYHRLGQHDKAYRYAQQSIQLKDSLTAAEKLRELNLYEARFQSTKKQSKIAELELINAKKEFNVLMHKREKTVIIISAVALLCILGLLYRQSLNKNIIAAKEKALKDEQIENLKQKQQLLALQHVLKIQDEERTRIARDLHDSIGGLFTTLKMYISTLGDKFSPLRNDALFQKSINMVDTANSEVRKIAHNMMPEVLVRLGLSRALNDLCSSVSVNNKLKVKYIQNDWNKRLDMDVEKELFKIVQELLHNAIRHSGASNIIVQRLLYDDQVHITVEDDGIGFEVQNESEQAKAGLNIIRSRVEAIGARLNIDSVKNRGTTIMIELDIST